MYLRRNQRLSTISFILLGAAAVSITLVNLTYGILTAMQMQRVKRTIVHLHDVNSGVWPVRSMAVSDAPNRTATNCTSELKNEFNIAPKMPSAYQNTQSSLRRSDSNLPTDPKHCMFRVRRQHGGYYQCDTLQVTIQAKDSLKRLKSVGGDYFQVWVQNTEQNATAAADDIVDHGNGTYTATLTLFWLGDARINVMLIHTSEAVAALKRIQNSTVPRNAYDGIFMKDRKTYVSTPCHMSVNMYINSPTAKAPTRRQFCNYTDPNLGLPWFCLKPDNYSCDMYQRHLKKPDKYRTAKKVFASLMNDGELEQFKKTNINIQRHPASARSVYVNAVNDKSVNELQTCLPSSLPKCTMGLNPRPIPQRVAGYYYQDQWTSRVCRTRTFNGDALSVRKCLKNKYVQFYGDSTGRQWFEYLMNTLRGVGGGRDPTLGGATFVVNSTNAKNGPITGFDKTDNITLSYMFHGLPFASDVVFRVNVDYIANRMDKFNTGGPDAVIIISIWAHFWIADLRFYREQLRTIKDAILRLTKRAPGTRILFKSPNTIHGSATYGFTMWGMAELDRVLREEMSGVNYVTVIDVWDMTIGHRSGLNIHPSQLIIEQEVNIMLSFICP